MSVNREDLELLEGKEIRLVLEKDKTLGKSKILTGHIKILREKNLVFIDKYNKPKLVSFSIIEYAEEVEDRP